MKTNCIIVHGCPSKPMPISEYTGHWIPWLKEELIRRGIDTQIALMPKPWAPDYSEYKKAISNYKINNQTTLIGHSCGCAFLVRWLGETSIKVKKLILVAPWKIAPEHDKFRELFYNYQINTNVTGKVGEIIMFTSNNEEDGGKKSLQIFHKVIGGKIITLENMGHYTIEDMGTEKIPELLNEVLAK